MAVGPASGHVRLCGVQRLGRWALLGLKACFDAEAAAGLRALYEFRVEEEVFHARIDDGTIETVHGPAQHPDVIITTSRETFRDLAASRSTLAEAISSGAASASGDRQAVHRLHRLFRLPLPQTRSAAPAHAS
ncbi:alkyl sulfatase C-terminal domain-containing protein [Microtetraspora malaysiensis]|uniref:alkyl sulfatase C-terminal domain-containing protein n=1 Tax=Microtetraspora malaysiensis TaxID=161358 RepID=UPI003D931DAD